MSNEENEDLRTIYIKHNCLQLLHLDVSFWDELIWKEDNQAIIKEFIDVPSASLLLFYLDHNSKLMVSLDVPASKTMPEIIAYFVKNNVAISEDNYKLEVMYGNIDNSPLMQYHKLFNKVPKNHYFVTNLKK